MHLADAFIQSDLQLHSGYTFSVSICVPWESNPQPFGLLTQCSTTEPQEHRLQTDVIRARTPFQSGSEFSVLIKEYDGRQFMYVFSCIDLHGLIVHHKTSNVN